ncbi:hypothetical protein C0992_000129, partial [Termitomyces sp. T32_za158]
MSSPPKSGRSKPRLLEAADPSIRTIDKFAHDLDPEDMNRIIASATSMPVSVNKQSLSRSGPQSKQNLNVEDMKS